MQMGKDEETAMTSRKVTQFKCDHCGKRSLSASHMAKHERHCTKNPNRICRVCKMVDHDQKPMVDLLALLPDPRKFAEPMAIPDGYPEPDEPFYGPRLLTELIKVFPRLREATSECPGCIMAALRQKGIPLPLVADLFDFSTEMKDLWNEINNDRAQEEERENYRAACLGNL